MFSSHHLVRFDDVDGAGIVYYPRYLHFCHKTFEDLFNQRSAIKYPQLIKEHQLGFPTVHVEADYFKPFYYGDEIKVIFRVKAIKNSSLITHYEFFNKAELSFSALITVVCMDLQTKKSRLLSTDMREFFSGLVA
jgi:4-hydroxybenzoyl-CoA thioesterase